MAVTKTRTKEIQDLDFTAVEGLVHSLRDQRDAVLEELKVAVDHYHQLEAVKAAEEKVAAMSDSEREALRQVISPQGVEPTTRFGNVG